MWYPEMGARNETDMRGWRTAIIVVAAGVALAAPSSPWAQQAPAPRPATGQTSLASGDRTFMQTVAKGGMAEVALGELAVTHAENEDVKKFGRRMVEDHGKANQELAQLAKGKGVEVAKDLDRTYKSTMNRLAKLQGDAFDRAYVEEMVKDHRKDVKDFERQAERGKDPSLKEWAGKTLPTLREHLREIENISAKVLAKR
jgi:putative membrane protein